MSWHQIFYEWFKGIPGEEKLSATPSIYDDQVMFFHNLFWNEENDILGYRLDFSGIVFFFKFHRTYIDTVLYGMIASVYKYFPLHFDLS